ncbi:MAG TPA: hypothetical protein VFZ34_33475 [Blastocatellia bacterium]|nr:hypothetical protein [Blastocatellia bacterium]
MQTKHFIAIATLTAALTSTAFGQWHPEIDKVKTRRPQTQSIQSPRDVASGQATGRRKAPRAAQDKLGNFEIQDIKSPRDTASGQATGITSPRDVASGQATGKRKAPRTPNGALLEFQIPEKVTQGNTASGQGAQQVQPGNSGGTITNQRSKRPTQTANAHDKYANQEVSYRSKPQTRKPSASQVTHDPEFEGWANRKAKRRTR